VTIQLGNGEFYGHTLVERSTPHLNLVWTRYGRGQRLPVHAHERPYLALVACGGFREDVDGRGFDCEEGSVILNTIGAEHSDRFLAERTEVVNVELAPEWIVGLRADGWRDERPAWTERLPVRRRIRGLWRELTRADNLSAFVIEGLCAELLALATSTSRARASLAPAWLKRVEEVLATSFRRPPGLSELGALAAVSPSRLARVFRAHNGCSVGGFARRLRVEHARRAVEGTRRGFAEIALEAGYADQSHMIREFRRHLGCTPGELRRA
jgi:AraC family transcriptional regulator